MSPPPAAAAAPALADSARLFVPVTSEAHEALLRRNAFLAVVLAALCIGFSAIFVRLSDVGPAAIGFWRLVFALGPTVIWAYAEQRAARARRRAAGDARSVPLFTARQFLLASLAGAFFAADLISFHVGLAHTTTANALLLANLAVVIVMILGWAILGERPTRGLIGALVLALIGTALIISSSATPRAGTSASVFGDMICIAAAVCYASYMLATRLLRRGGEHAASALGGGMASVIICVVGAALCLVWALATGEVIMPRSPQGLMAVIGLGLVAHAAGQGLTTFALGRLPAGLISIVLLLQIVVGATLAAFLFGEIPSLMVMVGGLMVVAGVVVARPPRARPS